MRKLLFLMVALVALWSGYWFVGSNAVRKGVNGWFADAAAQGLVAENTGVTVAGFPNRWDLTVEGLQLADLDAAFGWKAPFVQVFAMTWKPWHIIAAFPPEQTVFVPDDVITLTSEDLKASLRAAPSTDLPLAEVPEGYEGGAVTYGVRPENIALAASTDPAAVTVTVEMVELTGPEKLAHLRMGSQTLLASLPPASLLEVGDTRHVVVDLAEVLLFDGATGLRIDHG